MLQAKTSVGTTLGHPVYKMIRSVRSQCHWDVNRSVYGGVEASDSRAAVTSSAVLYLLQSWRSAGNPSRPRAEAAVDIEVRDGDGDAQTAASRHKLIVSFMVSNGGIDRILRLRCQQDKQQTSSIYWT